uniref:Uncharacterized protein n=1 Tax=Salix viminalis TaxID=40686 RepID=A0A6N2LDL2_SALVM
MRRLGKDGKLKSCSVPLKPKSPSVKLVTLPELSQVIPTQLWHGLVPTQEESRDWLWLSRLAFHFERASASVLLPNTEVAEEPFHPIQSNCLFLAG